MTYKIFISYRRQDSMGSALTLYGHLSAAFSPEQVFMDIDDIQEGQRFPQILDEALASAELLVAVIGSKWLTMTDGQGRPRLARPKDFVRREIETALDRDIPIIPVLLGGVEMPRKEELPRALAGLADHHALKLRPGVSYKEDVDQLQKRVATILWDRHGRPRLVRWAVIVGFILLLVIEAVVRGGLVDVGGLANLLESCNNVLTQVL